MATSYPDKTNARGIWKLSDITRNIKGDGTYPQGGGVRAVIGGGETPSFSNVIDYVSLSSTGDATDFGDLATVSGTFLNCCSDSHGGLGGY